MSCRVGVGKSPAWRLYSAQDFEPEQPSDDSAYEPARGAAAAIDRGRQARRRIRGVQPRGLLRGSAARIVFHEGLGRRLLIHDDKLLGATDDPLQRLVLMPRIEGEPIVL
jgi:hypothetical protein